MINEHDLVYKKLQEQGHEGWGGNKYESRMSGWKENLDFIFKTIDLKEGKVLELGSGAGDVSIKLSELGYDVTGIEISPTAVEWANKKALDKSLSISFTSASVSDESLLEGEKYDLIIDGNCIHCLFNEDRVSLYSNVKRLLKDDGYFFIASAILTNENDPTPKLSSIERCVLSKDQLELELKENAFIKIDTWISKNETHSHYRGIYRKG